MFNNYSINEFNEAKQKILDDFGNNFKHTETPNVYMIVGQPGVGKSTIATLFFNKFDKNIIFINGDDYRQYHPNYKEICDYFGDNSVEYTKKFSGEMTETLIYDNVVKLK